MVLIIWLFVVLVIASSYTANLSSILTVRQIEPQIKSLEALLQSKDPVGYPEGSFVRPFLVHHFGIEEEMLVPISSPEQYTEALRKGPQNGGVSAVIDDLISIQIFLPTKCGYKTVGPTYGFEGYGFVFQKGSPLVADFSKGVLSLSQSDQMGNIRNKWLREITCPEVEAVDNRLDLKNLWVLFLITGSASFIAVVIRFFSRLSLMSLLISNFTHFFFFRMLLRIFVYDAGKNPIGLIAS